MTENRLAFIDALRGVAILMVIANHAAAVGQAQGLARYAGALGAYGVQLFFVISACTIFLTLDRAQTREQSPLRNFFIRRLMRIVPLYWIAVALYALVYGSASRGWTDAPQAWHYPMHLLLLNVLHPATQSSAVPGGWSISVEVLFYLTVPLWFALVTTLRRAMWFVAASVVLGPLAVEALSILAAPLFSDVVDAKALSLFWYRSPLNQLGCFAFGILLFHGLKSPLHVRLAPHRHALAAAALVLWLVALRLPNTQHVVSGAFTLFALAVAARPPRWLVNRAMGFVGKVSYSAYVLHFLALAWAATWIAPSMGGWRFPLLVAIGAALTLPAAALSHRFIEQAFIQLGRRWIDSLERPAATSLAPSQRPGRP